MKKTLRYSVTSSAYHYCQTSYSLSKIFEMFGRSYLRFLIAYCKIEITPKLNCTSADERVALSSMLFYKIVLFFVSGLEGEMMNCKETLRSSSGFNFSSYCVRYNSILSVYTSFCVVTLQKI